MTNEEILNQLRDNMRAEVEAEMRAKILEHLAGATPTVQKPKHLTNGAGLKVPKAAKRIVGAKRSPGEIEQVRQGVLSFITDHPGANAESIKAALGVELSEITLPIKKLLAAKSITRKGVKRATRYYPKA